MIGKTLNHYEVLEKLGEGGMGHVYLAEDKRLNRQVALKVLPAELAVDPDRIERFELEAQAVAALNHPNIVTIFSVEEADGVRFLTMELIDGKSLDQLIPYGGLELGEFFSIAVPLASAAAAAHKKGITHRDIKPANVMVNSEGVVKLLDLGLARLRPSEDEEEPAQTADQTLTRNGRVLGTVPYMAPEQLSGKPIDHRVDIFSLGIVLYEMISGIRPFQGDSSAEIVSAILRDNPTPLAEHNASLPAHLGRVIRKCLEKDPRRRFKTTTELRDELQALQRMHDRGDLIVTVREERAAAKSRRIRNQWLLGTGVVLIVAILAGTVFSARQRPEPSVREDPGFRVAIAPTQRGAPGSGPAGPPLPFPEPPERDTAREVTQRQRPPQPPRVEPPVESAPEPQPLPPATDRQLRLRLETALSSGVITLYVGDGQIYRRDFDFEQRKRGLLGRVGLKRRVGGEIDDSFTVPAGTETVRLYVALSGQPAKQFILETDPRALQTERLTITVDEKGGIVARITPQSSGD